MIRYFVWIFLDNHWTFAFSHYDSYDRLIDWLSSEPDHRDSTIRCCRIDPSFPDVRPEWFQFYITRSGLVIEESLGAVQ